MREELIFLRKKRGLTQNEAAKLLGISQSFYSAIELGERKPHLKTMMKFEKVFEVSYRILFADVFQEYKERVQHA